MSEVIHSDRAVILTDEGTFFVMDTLRYTYDHVAVFLECSFYFSQELILIKCNLRKINQKRIIPDIFSCQHTRCCQPACMTPHNLNNRNRFFLIYICIDCDLTNSCSHISCSTSKARCVVCQHQVIVNCLRLTQYNNVTSNLLGIAGQLAYRIHRVISPDIEEVSNVHLFEFCKQFWIYFVIQTLRKFITAGSQISTRCIFQHFQFLARKCLCKLQNCSVQKSLNAIHHTIHLLNFLRMSKCL